MMLSVPLISLVITLIVVGVLLWLLQSYGAQFIDATIVRIIHVVVIICVVLWLLSVLLGYGGLDTVRVGP